MVRRDKDSMWVEGRRTSETLVNFYQTTRCYNPEDSNLHIHCRENLKSYSLFLDYKYLFVIRNENEDMYDT
jgi:hypothetical protein